MEAKEPLCKKTTIYRLTINPDHLRQRGVFFYFTFYFSFSPTMCSVINAIRDYQLMEYLEWTKAEAIYALGKVGLPTLVGGQSGFQTLCYSPCSNATISIHLEKIDMIIE